jgi:ubiquitin-activating enzyme E1 C
LVFLFFVFRFDYEQIFIGNHTVYSHFCKIQEKDESFYRMFGLVICGLDSVEARRWINGQVVSMLRREPDGSVDPSSVVPLVDGGTEGFRGQVKVVMPGSTSCLECILDAFAPPVTFPLCTLANTPRQPEHCIEYAALIQWPREHDEQRLDTDDPAHIDWLLDAAQRRAAEFGIVGVTRQLTSGVVKHIVPAIASTNAVVAAACASEALKIATGAAPQLSNFMSFNGGESVYTYTFDYLRQDECLVCGRPQPLVIALSRHAVVSDLVDALAKEPALQLTQPSISAGSRTVYAATPAALQRMTASNLGLPLTEFVGAAGGALTVTDPALRLGVAEIVLKLA